MFSFFPETCSFWGIFYEIKRY